MNNNKDLAEGYTKKQVLEIIKISESQYHNLFRSRNGNEPTLRIHDGNNTEHSDTSKFNKKKFLSFKELMFVEIYITYHHFNYPPQFFQELYNQTFTFSEEGNKTNILSPDFQFIYEKSQVPSSPEDLKKFENNKELLDQLVNYNLKTKKAKEYRMLSSFEVMTKGYEAWVFFRMNEHAYSKDGQHLDKVLLKEVKTQPIRYRWNDARRKQNKARLPLGMESRIIHFTPEFMDTFLTINLNNIRKRVDLKLKEAGY